MERELRGGTVQSLPAPSHHTPCDAGHTHSLGQVQTYSLSGPILCQVRLCDGVDVWMCDGVDNKHDRKRNMG